MIESNISNNEAMKNIEIAINEHLHLLKSYMAINVIQKKNISVKNENIS